MAHYIVLTSGYLAGILQAFAWNLKLGELLLWWSSGEDSSSQCKGLGSIPAQGTGSHMLRLRVHMLPQPNAYILNIMNLGKTQCLGRVLI